MNQTTAVGTFTNRDQAEKAVHILREKGFDKEKVSILAKGGQEKKSTGHGHGNDPVSDGATWGAGIGGATALLAGIGAIAVPGIGPVLAAGPIAAALTGAVGGSLVGALADYGIPAGRTQHIEQEVKSGKTVALVKADEKRAHQAMDLFREHGAIEVELD